MTLCECGCGEETTIYRGASRRFISGHNRRGKHVSAEHRANLSNALTGKQRSESHCLALSKSKTGIQLSDARKKQISEMALQEKEPLPHGYEYKDGRMTTNKECSDYLGCFVAERVLSKTFENVQVMPKNNHGYDFICGQGFKVDVKCSATGDKGRWGFAINKNDVANYFLLIAFDNRTNLTPIHLWLVPGDVLTNMIGITISSRFLDRWDQYEIPIDKVIECCDILRGN